MLPRRLRHPATIHGPKLALPDALWCRSSRPRAGARAFAEGEAKEHRLLVEKKRGQDGSGFYFVLNSSQRFEDGYLLKQVALKSLLLEEALPPLDELQRFNQARPRARPGPSREGKKSKGKERL